MPLLVLWLPGCAQTLDREWELVEEADSSIVFDAPGLASRKPQVVKSYNDRRSVFVENAIWTGPEARHAKAMVQYQRASPGHFLPAKADTRDIINRLAFFRDKEISYGPLQAGVNDIGRVEHQRLTFGNVSCVSFVQTWGSARGAGDRQITGYYCADPGSNLGEETISQVIKALSVRQD